VSSAQTGGQVPCGRACYLAENGPVAALLALSGGAGKQSIHDGIAEVIVGLDRERVDVRGFRPGGLGQRH
jgi:hypothetical protein